LLLNKAEAELENFMELIEGTAKYIEYGLSESLQKDYLSIDEIRHYPEFQNYRGLTGSSVSAIQNAKTGDLSSGRFYISGTLICLLLDRYSKYNWKENFLS